MQDGHVPQESSDNVVVDGSSGSPNREAVVSGEGILFLSHTMNWASAIASCSAPLPSLPRKSKA
jgi:hypothetical protein